MSDDILDRLRSVGPETWVDHVAMAKEAADEIESLRVQLDAAVRELGKQGRELGKVEADNAALREALGDLIRIMDRNQRPGGGSDVPARIRKLLETYRRDT